MWAFHQALGELEKKASVEGVSIISPRTIEFDAFDKWMRSNLDHDDWSNEREEWEAGD